MIVSLFARGVYGCCLFFVVVVFLLRSAACMFFAHIFCPVSLVLIKLSSFCLGVQSVLRTQQTDRQLLLPQHLLLTTTTATATTRLRQVTAESHVPQHQLRPAAVPAEELQPGKAKRLRPRATAIARSLRQPASPRALRYQPSASPAKELLRRPELVRRSRTPAVFVQQHADVLVEARGPSLVLSDVPAATGQL